MFQEKHTTLIHPIILQTEAVKAEARATARPRLFEVGGSARARGQAPIKQKT